MADGSMRASDGDRERVVTVLREQAAEGRITLDEFEERMGAAYAASTWDDLRELTRDLPVRVTFGEPQPAGTEPRAPTPAQPSQAAAALRRNLTVLAPVLAIMGVVALLAAAPGNPARFAPLLFIGVFWAFCSSGRGCSTRAKDHDDP